MNLIESLNKSLEKRYNLKERKILKEAIQTIPRTILETIQDEIKDKLKDWYWSDRDKVKLRSSSSFGNSKTNLVIDRKEYGSWTKDQLQELSKAVKSIGGKFISTSYGEVNFYLDVTPYIQAEKDKEDAERKAYEAELDALDIEEWYPSQTILDKLTNYMNRGARVNVKAIKDINKVLTYYYGARLIGFNSLIDQISDEYYSRLNGHADISKEMDAIDRKVTKGKSEVPDQAFAERFSPVVRLLVDKGIKYNVKKRKPTSDEMERDRHNGTIWTLAWDLILNPGTGEEVTIALADHTSEAVDAPSYGYMINGREVGSKKRLAQEVARFLGIE